MNYNLQEIAAIINARLIGNPNSEIEYLLYDSRRIVPSENSLFFAFQGKRDGHLFIEDMIKKGVRNFVVQRLPNNIQANFLLVNNTYKALHTLTAYHRRRFNIPIIAITGSNGKTIVKEWLAYILNEFYKIAKSPKSFNSQIGVPLSIWEISPDVQIAIIEAGISRPNEMESLQRIIMPTFGIFTNLGDAHQENFSSYREKLNEKLKLFSSVKKIYFCRDDKFVFDTITKKYGDTKELLTWSMKYKDADLYVEAEKHNSYTLLHGYFRGKEASVKIPFTDEASVANAITVWLFLNDFLGREKIPLEKFETLPQIEMRLQQIRGANNSIIINDAYNSDFTSLRIAIDYLCSQKVNKDKVIILSDMEQISNEKRIYKQVVQLINKTKIKTFIGIGKHLEQNAEFFHFTDKHFFISTDEFLRALPSFNFKNKVILIKGARKFQFEKISQLLENKRHRTVFEINLNALEYNLDYFRSFLKSDTKIMVMVKAFSYGSGSYEIASFLQNQNVDYLGVAIADEGVELREAGISLPIMVMNPEVSTFQLLINYQLEPEIYTFSILEHFYKTVKKYAYHPIPIHIKINTGMNRLGFEPEEVDKLISILQEYSDFLYPKSVFSHLVASSEPQFDEFTQMQIHKFLEVKRKFEQNFRHKIIFHILNSGGIERYPQYQMDMVRLGIGLYGISAIDNSLLKHIGTLKTHILQIREVKAGESIGYSRAQFVKRDSRIATLPIGYADGLNRKLSCGKGKVWIKGYLAPIVGNICMDLTMVDITDIPNVNINDEVIIFGNQLPITTIAQWLDTIPYEVLTSVSHRVRRVYLWE